jgi:uroporphyrin-3 C-methyltransferase
MSEPTPAANAGGAATAGPPAAESPAREPAPAPAPAASVRGLSLIVIGAAALGAVGLAGWQWYDSRSQTAVLKEELARRLAEGDARGRETLQSAKDSRELVRELETKLAVLENRLAESQNQQLALEALYQELARNRDEWSLAEIEQTMMIAAQQLQLAGNVRAAILALQGADARLQRIDRPQLAPLRKVINRDIERLQATPYVDVVGLSVKLDALIAAVDVWPLAMEQRPQPEKPVGTSVVDEPNAFVRIAREMWQDLRGLVRIQTVDRPDTPLLAPTQSYFLRENLKLRLLSARFALLQHDEKTFRGDLRAAREWLTRYYETRDKALAAPLATLKQLSDTAIGIELPDINASLDAVRNYKLTRDKAPR